MFATRLVVRRYNADHQLLEERDLGSGLITTAGVNLWAADWTSPNALLKLAKYHDSGTGTNAPTIADTGLQTPATASQQGSTRATGTQSNTNNVYRTIGTITYTATVNVTEWGLFTDPATGTLVDRRTFPAMTPASGQIIEFDYTLAITAGG